MKQLGGLWLLIAAAIFPQTTTAVLQLKSFYPLPSTFHTGSFVSDADGTIYVIFDTASGQLMFSRFNQATTTAAVPTVISVPAVASTEQIFFSSANKSQLIVSLNANAGASAGQSQNLGLDSNGTLLWSQKWSSGSDNLWIASQKDALIYNGLAFDVDRSILLRVGETGDIVWSTPTNYSFYLLWSAKLDPYSPIVCDVD